MAHVVFYEKPGCSSNTRQKQILRAAGVELDVRNLLTQVWTRNALRGFFHGKPVAEWFNKNAPRVKSGEVDPAAMDADTALAAMVAEPLLIRRPLIESGDLREAGFDWPSLAQRLGLSVDNASVAVVAADLERCKHTHSELHCHNGSASHTREVMP